MIKGTSGDDNLAGTSGNDVFDMAQGGNDTVDGGGGNDVFRFGATFHSGDSVDGGTGNDKLSLDGDYSTTLVINSTMLSNVEQIAVAAGHTYAISILDGVIGHGQSLLVNATALGASDQLTLDGSGITGASADTTLIVSTGAGLTFFIAGAGSNILHGGSGGDYVSFGGDFDSHDHIDAGGGNNNTLSLDGDYSAGLTLTAAMMTNFNFLQLTGDHSYKITMNDGNVGAGQSLFVNATGFGAGDHFTFNGAHETDGNFSVTDSIGDDVIMGGALGDSMFGYNGGIDKIYGNGGDDLVNMSNTLTAADHVDGGSGTDELDLGGDYSGGLTFKATTMVNFESLFLGNGNSYKLTLNDGNVAAGQHLIVNGDLLGAGDTLVLDGSHETDGSLYIGGGAGDDVLIGGQAGNTINGGFGQDLMTAGAGSDVFLYVSDGQSSGAARDIVTGYDALHDSFDIPETVGAIDAALNSGLLRAGHFDGDLAAAIDAAHLGAHDAMLFTPDSGGLAGHTFLIVDVNGVAGYQAGVDMVIQLESGAHLGSLSVSDFS